MAIYDVMKLAEKGNAEAQNSVGLYYYGYGDMPKAIEWWEKATVQNYADAMYNLAMCYYDGYGVVKNIDIARNLLQKASIQNHTPSIEALKRLFNLKVFNFIPGIDDPDFY